MISADEYKFEFLNAYDDLATALEAALDAIGLLDEDCSREAVDALLRAPGAAKCIRAATDDFNQKVVALQRRSFQVLHGGRQ